MRRDVARRGAERPERALERDEVEPRDEPDRDAVVRRVEPVLRRFEPVVRRAEVLRRAEPVVRRELAVDRRADEPVVRREGRDEPLRKAAGISACTTAFVSCGIRRSRKLAMRSS